MWKTIKTQIALKPQQSHLGITDSDSPKGMRKRIIPSADVKTNSFVLALYTVAQLSVRALVTPATGGVQVTASGYERMEQIEASSYKSTRHDFVAMWFDKSRDAVYCEAIEPAIREAGYQAVRIDRTEHINRIDDEIIAQLRQSRFMVADFTAQRNGVYYEAGFMRGLGRNVFWVIEKQELTKVHFDLRQYNFIDYDSPKEAKDRLYYRIMAVEGKGPGAASSA
jgi:hypothetical protein